MSHDVVIRGGLLVDGIGGEPTRGDLAIDADLITEIGDVEAPGRREIDATGHIVTPGFVDIHTHLDAQIGWDPLLTPVSWHGVTTALIGNCGVTFAPVRPGDNKLLASMMETVEDISADLILQGLPWSWEGYGGYLDALETLDPAINVGGLVGHCAVRFYVMGERAVDEQPTESERRQMADVVGQAVADGAVGFSTSRFIGHVLPDGRDVPGTHAKSEELVAIAQAVAENGGGLMQNVLNLSGDFDGELALIRKLAETTGDRVLFSLTAGRSDRSGQRLNGVIDEMVADGLDVNAVAIPRGSGFVMGLCNILPWRKGAWKRLAKLDFSERVQAVEDSDWCEALIADARSAAPRFSLSDLFPLGGVDAKTPRYDFEPEDSLQAVADRSDEHPVETFLRLSRESEGRALFTLRVFNPNTRALADLIVGQARASRARRCGCSCRANHGCGLVFVRALPLDSRQGPVHDRRGRAPHDLGTGAHHGGKRPRSTRGWASRRCQCDRFRARRRAHARVRKRLSGWLGSLHPARRRLPRNDLQRSGDPRKRRTHRHT